MNSHLLHQLIDASAERTPDAPALSYQKRTVAYGALATDVAAWVRAVRPELT